MLNSFVVILLNEICKSKDHRWNCAKSVDLLREHLKKIQLNRFLLSKTLTIHCWWWIIFEKCIFKNCNGNTYRCLKINSRKGTRPNLHRSVKKTWLNKNLRLYKSYSKWWMSQTGIFHHTSEWLFALYLHVCIKFAFKCAGGKLSFQLDGYL